MPFHPDVAFAGLAVIRLVAGVGLGSAIPAFLKLASEYVSAPRRGIIAAVMYIGYPLRGAVGGLWTSYLLQYYSWPSVFYVGAIPRTRSMLMTSRPTIGSTPGGLGGSCCPVFTFRRSGICVDRH